MPGVSVKVIGHQAPEPPPVEEVQAEPIEIEEPLTEDAPVEDEQ